MPNPDYSKIHDHVASNLENEIERFWKRSLFFWGFIAASFVSYGILIERGDAELVLAISCFGIVCSVAWTLANRGSKYWQNAWEKKLRDVQTEALGCQVYSVLEPNDDRGIWGAARYSVTRLTIALSDFAVLVWVTLLFKASPAGRGAAWTCISIVMLGVTTIFVGAMLIGGRSRRPTYPR